jgi:S1-C subfamily serine protease
MVRPIAIFLITFLATTLNAEDKTARCVPNKVHSGGAVEGYVCSNIPATHPFQKAGVQNNDVIMSVDGEKLASVQDSNRLLSKITHGNYSTILVTREGKNVTLKK